MMQVSNFYYIEIPREIFSITSLWIKSGSNIDPYGKEGLIHFFEHLFLTKTKSFPNKIEALRAIDGAGLFYNAYTSKDLLYFYFLQQPDRLDKSFKYLIEGIQSFDINDIDIQKERAVIIEEQQKHKANPSIYLWALADKGLWPDSNLGLSGLGTDISVSNITKEDILSFKEILFNQDNLGFLTLSPTPNHEQLEKHIRDLDLNKEHISNSTKPNKNISNKVVAEYRAMDTICIAFSFLLPNIKVVSEDKIVLNFIKNYLASGWSSRLIEKIRLEKNYTYWVYGGLETFREGGFLRFSMFTKKQYLKEIMRIISEEIYNLKTKPISKEILDKHVTATKAHMLKHYIQPENMLWWYGWNMFIEDKEETIGKYINDLDLITPEQVMKVAVKYLELDSLHFAALGDIQENELIFE